MRRASRTFLETPLNKSSLLKLMMRWGAFEVLLLFLRFRLLEYLYPRLFREVLRSFFFF